jgi:hypothetical protein
VCLVKNEDLVAVPRWSKNCPLSKISRIINTVVAGRINFNYVQRTGPTARKLDTAVALAARGVGRTLFAV